MQLFPVLALGLLGLFRLQRARIYIRIGYNLIDSVEVLSFVVVEWFFIKVLL